jgi:glycerol-3-phosphate acyltransferase PlsY
VLTAVLCVALGFALGSLPFAVWLTRWLRRRDVRAVGDGNPGAANAWTLGGWRLGLAVLLLDVAKAAAGPAVGLFVFDVSGWALVPVALAPVLGHVFSPWLRFRGGKGIASTFGVWAVLTAWLVPSSLGLALVLWMQVQSTRAWTVVLGCLVAAAALAAVRPEPPLLVAFAANAALLAWTHRHDLKKPPAFHAPWARERR